MRVVLPWATFEFRRQAFDFSVLNSGALTEMDSPALNRHRARQITHVMDSHSVRRSPRLSQQHFQSIRSTGDSDESLGRSSLVMTHRYARGHSTVLDESGQQLPVNEASNSVSTTKQLKKSTQQYKSFSSTTGQPYTASSVEVGTESSEESDAEGVVSQPVGFVLPPSVTASSANSTGTSFRPRRTDMPQHLYDVEYIKRQRFVHHKEKIITPPRPLNADTTDSGVSHSKVLSMTDQILWRVSSFFYLISTFLLYLDVELLRRFYSLVNPLLLFYQRVSDIRQRSFASFCYLLLLAVAALPLVCLLCGVSLREEPVSSGTGDISIATVKEMLRKEVALQLNYLKNDNYFRNLVAVEILEVQQVILSNGTSQVEAMNRTLLEKLYAMNQSLDNTIREIGNQLNGSFAILVSQLQLGVVRNISWSEGNVTVNLTKHYQTQLEDMNRTHHGIIQHQQDMLNKVKDSLHQILNQTKEELSDVIDDNALESHEKHEQMATKLEKLTNVTQDLDENVVGIEKSVQELKNITDLLSESGSGNITAVFQKLNDVTSEILSLHEKFQKEVNDLKLSRDNDSVIQEKMTNVFLVELNKILRDGNSTFFAELSKLFASAAEMKNISDAMRILEKKFKSGIPHPDPHPSDISEVIRKIVKEELADYSADRLGKFDFALHSVGATVTNQRSPTFNPQSIKDGESSNPLGWWLSLFNARDASCILDPNVYPGQCWAFPGQEGYVTIKLADNILISEVAIEHIPRALSPYDDDIFSAPKDFSVQVSPSLSEEWTSVGDFVFTGEESVQLFSIQNPPEHFVRYIKFEFHSNHGRKEFTCVYRVRVHGKLYVEESKQNKKQS
ncbi:sun domain-containing protein 1-like isoform X2 [Dysidea avara]|uniref:sun domain-containing protein 1-like isoform X2 n=1 Tax=Dysidea avara TaxID=196820 RepID=UPI0033211EB5